MNYKEALHMEEEHTEIHVFSLFELALVPVVFLCLAFPGFVVVLLATLGQRDEQVGTVVSQNQRDLRLRHLLLAHLHLCRQTHAQWVYIPQTRRFAYAYIQVRNSFTQ